MIQNIKEKNKKNENKKNLKNHIIELIRKRHLRYEQNRKNEKKKIENMYKADQ